MAFPLASMTGPPCFAVERGINLEDILKGTAHVPSTTLTLTVSACVLPPMGIEAMTRVSLELSSIHSKSREWVPARPVPPRF